MTPNFVRQFAPELSLEGAAPQAGLVSERFDAQGMPLPFIQQGGQREYFDGLRGRLPETQAGLTAEPPAPVQPAQSPFGPRLANEPVHGIRGRQPVSAPTIDPPQNMLVTGRRGNTARIPPMQSPQEIEAQIANGAGLRQVGPTQESVENRVAGAATAERTMQELLGADNLTLGDILGQFNFEIPSFLRNTADGLRGRYDSIQDMPSVDTTANVNSGVHTGAPRFNVSTPEGLAEFNARMGMRLGNQVRTQAEQDSLFQRGLTPTRASRHLTGEAVDIRPRDIGGLTGQAAVNEVKRRLQAAGYTDMYVQWESGHGRNQGTGAHVHVQPPRQRR